LVEVKVEQSKSINKDLFYFQEKLQVPHAFQAAFSMEFVSTDCFSTNKHSIVPVKTLLSQLI